MDRERWPSAGAVPVDGLASVYAMRVASDLRALVSQTQSKGIEIIDIVRAVLLDQADAAPEPQGENG